MLRFHQVSWAVLRSVALSSGMLGGIAAIAPPNGQFTQAAQAAIVQLQSLNLRKPSVSGEATLPLSLLQKSRGVYGLEAQIGDRPGQFLVDTGASTTLLSKALKQSLGITGTPVPSHELSFAVAGKDCPEMTAARFTLPNFNIGNAQVTGLEALQFDQTLIPEGADGILGMDILSQFALTIDPVKQRLKLEQTRSPSQAQRLQAVSLTERSGVMLAQLRINEAGPFEVLLDTAADGTFISTDVAEAVGISQAEQKPIQMLGFCGLEDAAIAQLDSATLGHHRQTNLEAVITNSSVLTTLNIDGVLGQNFLRAYHQKWHFPTVKGAIGFLLLDEAESEIRGPLPLAPSPGKGGGPEQGLNQRVKTQQFDPRKR